MWKVSKGEEAKEESDEMKEEWRLIKQMKWGSEKDTKRKEVKEKINEMKKEGINKEIWNEMEGLKRNEEKYFEEETGYKKEREKLKKMSEVIGE